MQKIVIDTNVFVSALIQGSYPFLIITELFSNDKIALCISDVVFEEYFRVLNRKKFAKFPDFIANAQVLLIDIENRATKYFPIVKIDIINTYESITIGR